MEREPHELLVGDNDDFTVVHDADPSDDTSRGRLPFVLVVRDEQSDLDEARMQIAQTIDALAGCELLLFVLAGDAVFAAAFTETRFERPDLGAQLAQARMTRLRSLAYASCFCRSANHFLM